MNESMIGRRIARTICFAVVTILLLITVPKNVGAETQEIQLQTAVTVKAADLDSRSFAVTLKLWSDMSAYTRVEPTATVLVLDVSAAMLQLVDVPDGKSYLQNVLYESIDDKKQLYTLVDGIYRPIFHKDGSWYLAQWDKAGNRTAKGDSIGERLTGEEAGDRFTVRVYEKGNAKTRLEYQTEAARRYIREMAALSPKCKIALVYYSGETTAEAPLYLTKEDVKKLEESLSACEKLVKGEESGGLTALKSAANIAAEYVQQEFKTRSVIFLGGSPCTELESAEKRLANSLEITKGMRENGTEIYAVNLLPENAEMTALLAEIATSPKEGGYQEAAAANLSDMLHGFLAKAVNAETVSVALNLDPRFTLTAAQRKTLAAAGGKAKAGADGALQISWPVTLPVLAENSWEKTFTITAQGDYFGGNDIAFAGEKTGVYLQEKKLADFQCPSLNIPVKLELKDLKTAIFLGQRLPAKIEEKSLEEAMGFLREQNWYNKGESGVFTVAWETEDGVKIGDTRELQKITPGKNQVYFLSVDYRPSSSGHDSVGTANRTIRKTAQLQVEVVSGKIRLKLNLQGKGMDALGGTYLFKLTNGADVRYTAVNMHNRNEDGEGIVLEAVFDSLPLGTYTLTQEYFYTDTLGLYKEEGEIVQCRVGYAKGSDLVDLDNAELSLYPVPYTGSGEISADTRAAQVKINGYQIETEETD